MMSLASHSSVFVSCIVGVHFVAAFDFHTEVSSTGSVLVRAEKSTATQDWMKVGSGMCSQWGRSWTWLSGHKGTKCHDACTGRDNCNFYCQSDTGFAVPTPNGPSMRYCWQVERCTGLETTFAWDVDHHDASDWTCYRRPGADDCTVPDALHGEVPPGRTEPTEDEEFVEMRGPFGATCRDAFGKSSCEGSIDFKFTCSANTHVKFAAEVTTPDHLAQALLIDVDHANGQSWGLKVSPNGGWGMGATSPGFDVTAGEHVVRFLGRTDGMRIRTAKILGNGCSFTVNGESHMPALSGELHGMFVRSWEGAPPSLFCDGEWLELGSGKSISYGAKCWSNCPWQYSPPGEHDSVNERTLTCGHGGKLDPPTFSCRGNPCHQPLPPPQSAAPRCKELEDPNVGMIPHGGNCTTQCQSGRCSTMPQLHCHAGVLDPPTYSCEMCDCDPPTGVANIVPGESACKGADKIDHGALCIPNCAQGFFQSEVSLKCIKSQYTPATFTCDPEPHPFVQQELCRNECHGDQACIGDCYLRWVPVLVRTKIPECQAKCNYDFWEEARDGLRWSCRSGCRDQTLALYREGLIDYPEWRVASLNCTERWNDGCRFKTDQQERHQCFQACDQLVPEAAKAAHHECWSKCETDLPEGPMTENEKQLYVSGCRGLCWIQAAKDYEDHKDLQRFNGSDGLQELAKEVRDVKNELQSIHEGMLSDMRQALTGVMQAQWMSEEATRQSGGTGAKKVRTNSGGSHPYHAESFSSPALMSQHNHANGFNTVGLGEFSAVVNGVSFRTRHNDYSLKMPHRTDEDWHKVEDIPRPPVPPSVLAKADLNGQIAELRTYFKAFKNQDVSLRDYRPYFKPVLCYMETGWENLDQDELTEPFESDRHHIAATGWKDLLEKIRYYDLTGNKDRLENVPWLPTSLFDVEIKNGRLRTHLAKWGYRILCHPVDGDVETARLHLVKDSYIRVHDQNRFRSHEDHFYSRNARFRVDPRLALDEVLNDPDAEVAMGRSYLDLLMEQIPGKNNYGANMQDTVNFPKTSRLEPYKEGDSERATKGTAINKQHEAGDLNTGYYSRYMSGARDAMGRDGQRRGYNDPNLWAAMTTHDVIANISLINSGSTIRPGKICYLPGTKDPCPRISQRWTYATPVEIIYLTPLFEWNPYGVPTDEEGGTGKGLRDDPFTVVYRGDKFFRTPLSFFGTTCEGSIDEPADSADTDREAVWVKDKDGTPRQVLASGQQITTRCIQGVGPVRLRYNIMPIHEEGSTTYKEVKALERLIEEHIVPQRSRTTASLLEGEHGRNQTLAPPGTILELILKGGSADHEHVIKIHSSKLEALQAGDRIWTTSERSQNHVHHVEVTAHPKIDDESDHDFGYQIIACETEQNQLTGKCEGPGGSHHVLVMGSFQSHFV